MKDFLKKNLNIPNILSLIRLLMIPVFLVLFHSGLKYQSLAVFLLACLTDLFDGLIARKYNQITDLGKLMDPLADKLMILTVMFSMVLGNQYIQPVIPLSAVIVLLCKELFMMLGGLLMLKEGIVVYSFFIGKLAHCLFIAALAASFFHEWFVRVCVGWPMTPDLMLVWLAVLCALSALAFYVTDSVQKVLKKKRA
ncbi:MAG: CDP-alcohol phosphatidyltransferase family protein [Eubacteriales bacterium]|nr:CDP-alcohol phosphatidyltransferase family protein [Eubacteriales bacterium]